MAINHSSMKLGRKPARFDARIPKFRNYLTAQLPPAPPVCDWTQNVSRWRMLKNDVEGDCTSAGCGHQIVGWSANASTEAVITDQDAESFYSASCGYIPGDESTDQGGVELDVLTYWLKNDYAGHKLDAFANLDVGNHTHIKNAIWLTGGVYIGVNLPISAQSQEDVWDVPQAGTAGDGKPGSWGGHCLAPGTRILTADLQWVPVETLKDGDTIIGFDENKQANGKRSYKKSVVEATMVLDLPCYDVEFADGTKIRAAYDHLWLCDDGNGGTKWIKTENLRSQSHESRQTSVLKPIEPWDTDHSRDAGYLAAAFDGEGWISTGGEGRGIHRMGFCQRDNEMFSRVCGALQDRSIPFRLFDHHSGFKPENPIKNLAISGRNNLLKFLGSVRPHRLLPKFSPDNLGTMFCGRMWPPIKEPSEDETVTARTLGGIRVPVTSVTYVGNNKVIGLQTSSRTYISEGFASHNCVVCLGYTDKYLVFVSWGRLMTMTWAFWDAYVEEAWVLLSKDWLRANGVSPSGFLYQDLIEDMKALDPERDPIQRLQHETGDPVLCEFHWKDVTLDIHQAAATYVLGLIASAFATYGYMVDSNISTFFGIAIGVLAGFHQLTTIGKSNVSTKQLVEVFGDIIAVLQKRKIH